MTEFLMWMYIISAIVAGIITQINKMEIFKISTLRILQVSGKPANSTVLFIVFMSTMVINVFTPILNTLVATTGNPLYPLKAVKAL